jgi:hypothetical protein
VKVQLRIVRKVTPLQFAKLIRSHAETTASNSLYQGQDWLSLAEWLTRPLQSCIPTEMTQSGFAWMYILKENASEYESVGGLELTLPMFDTLHLKLSRSSVLIFLRGYPTPDWINEIGAYFCIDPETFYRHLTFFHQPGALLRQSPLRLPSSRRSIFQFLLTTVGQYHPKAGYTLSDTRVKAAKAMRSYLQNMGKASWRLGDSIVRHFDIHNESTFSFEQLVTVHVSNEGGTGSWTGKLHICRLMTCSQFIQH